MTVHPIRELPEPVLRQKAKRVPNAPQRDARIQQLIDDMIESMEAARGVGLAAPQIGVSLRVIVIGLPDEEPFALINPEIVKVAGERQVDEGCLSVPGYHAELVRHRVVVAKGLNREGKEVRIKARDTLLAQALEHEIDHINGTLYIDHLDSLDELQKVEPGESISRETTPR
ncbi:MAG: peptide deformylase [Chloroflexi bacterium]|nr:peptide deformylase [Chloroflexota bacterium]